MTDTPTDPPADLDSLSYEELLALLEALTTRMASGSIGIEEAADLYDRAAALHVAASARLARIRERIDRLAPPLPQSEGPMA